MSQDDDASRWLDAMGKATDELAVSYLAFDTGCQIRERRATMPRGIKGAFVTLLTKELSTQIGIASSRDGCHTLAQAMMGADEGEALPDEDVADVLGEIANIVAGGVKTRLSEGQSIELGLPVVINGEIEASGKAHHHSVDVAIGPVEAYFLVMQGPRVDAAR